MATDETVSFNIERELNKKNKDILKEVYSALEEKGYNPINQIVGYLIRNDLGYIPDFDENRNKIAQIDRTFILENMLKDYLK